MTFFTGASLEPLMATPPLMVAPGPTPTMVLFEPTFRSGTLKLPLSSITRGLASPANATNSAALRGRTGAALPPPMVVVTPSPATLAQPTSADAHGPAGGTGGVAGSAIGGSVGGVGVAGMAGVAGVGGPGGD